MATPASVRTLIFAQQQVIQVTGQENDELGGQPTVLATKMASLREQTARSSRNFSKPPSSGAQLLRALERPKVNCRKHGG